MCINPRRMNNGIEVPCRKCWQCKTGQINDWIGRCIAETTTSTAAYAVTLTYGPDATGDKHHQRTVVLTYSDVQKYLKKLRFDGYSVRYFAVGEFGSAKGRCHWHVILFFQGKSPTHKVGERFTEPHWDHGFSHWEPADHGSIRYACKYITKDLRDAERQRQVSMSKYPPLGAGYFVRLAQRYADQGLPLAVPQYHFPDVRDKSGELIKFWIKGKSQDILISSYLDAWKAKHGGHPPHSELVEEWLDKNAGYQQEVAPKAFRPREAQPWIAPPIGAVQFFSASHNSWAYELDGQTLFWSFDMTGKRAWQSVIRTEAQAELLREASERRKRFGTYRDQSRGT